MVRTHEPCKSRGGRPQFPVPNKPYCFCGRKAKLKIWWEGEVGWGRGVGGGGVFAIISCEESRKTDESLPLKCCSHFPNYVVCCVVQFSSSLCCCCCCCVFCLFAVVILLFLL